jgi:hypothetical protein
MIRSCGDDAWARTVVLRVQRLRTSTDKLALVGQWKESQWLRDSTFFAAALDIAGDRGASVPARVYAFVALTRWNHPEHDSEYPGFTGGFTPGMGVRGGCSFQASQGYHYSDTRSLPANHTEITQAVARRVALDQTEPIDVRTAASCAYSQDQTWMAHALAGMR